MPESELPSSKTKNAIPNYILYLEWIPLAHYKGEEGDKLLFSHKETFHKHIFLLRNGNIVGKKQHAAFLEKDLVNNRQKQNQIQNGTNFWEVSAVHASNIQNY